MDQQPEDALYAQCWSRVWIHFTKQGGAVAAMQLDAAANWLVRQLTRNTGRLPLHVPYNPLTGVPDSYIDEIIRFAAIEGPRIVALRIGQPEAWDKMLDLLARRVRASLRHYSLSSSMRDSRSDDLIQQCAYLIWNSLDRYHYDSTLEAWASRFVAYEVALACRATAFRKSSHVLSLERAILEPDNLMLGEALPDECADRDFRLLETWLTLELGCKKLSNDQREVILRRLRGEDVVSIATSMERSVNAVYKLQQRASAVLAAFAHEQDIQ